MAGLTTAQAALAQRLKDRKLPNVEVPQVQEAELGRSLEAIKEHLRLYEGDSGAPKERFVTLAELENAGLLTAKTKNKFSYISQVQGIDVSPPSAGTARGPSTTTIIDSGGGADTLVDLLDTNMLGQGTGDLFFNAGGGEWQPTMGQLIWIPIPGYLQLADGDSINWVVDSVSEEFAVVANSIPGGTPDTDPNLGSVVLLITAETVDPGQETFLSDIGGHTFTWAFSVGPHPAQVDGHIDTDFAKFGTRSVYAKDTGGAAEQAWASPSSADWDLSSGDFTIEFHAYIQNQTSNIPWITRWISGQRSWRIFSEASNGRLAFEISTTGSNLINILTQKEGIPTLLDDTWYHIALTRSGNDYQFWLDGVALGTSGTDSNTIFHGTSVLQLMAENSGAGTIEANMDNIRITKGVARYTTTFTPPSGPFDGSAGDVSFTLGDPAVATIIDGVTIGLEGNTAVTGTFGVSGATDLATTLDVIGASTLGTVVATSYEGILAANILSRIVAEDVSGKFRFTSLTTGDDRGGSINLYSTVPGINWTATGDPTEEKVWLDFANAGQFRRRAYADNFGTWNDFDIITRTGIAVDWAWTYTAVSAPNTDVDFDAITATSYGGIVEADLLSRIVAETITGAYTFNAAVRLKARPRIVSDTTLSTPPTDADAKTIAEINFYDSDETDIIGQVGFLSTAADNAMFMYNHIHSAWSYVAGQDSTGAFTPYLTGDPDGATTLTAATNVVVNATLSANSDVSLVSGADLIIWDGTNVDNATFSHDGTDFNIVFTTTADWNITGITSIQAGTVDADFDAITATSYGGIVEADLLDKSATEAIGGAWTFNADVTMADNIIDQPRLKDYSIESDAPTVVSEAVTLVYSDGPNFEVDMEPATAAVVITISGGPPAGTYGRITLKVQQDGATAQTLSFAGTTRNAGGTLHPVTTTLDGITIYKLHTWDGGTTWDISGEDFS